ncbi:hypothetical protein M1D34_27655 (plasmid) [Ensifer sp. D2-11]
MNRVVGDVKKKLLCAANNADLYKSIFRAWNLPDQCDGDLWSSESVAPPYYSNLTTLNPAAAAKQLTEILRLQATLGRQFSLKDGFGRLDLANYGFHVLFSAEWIWAERSDLTITLQPGWHQIRDAEALVRWERSWKNGGSPTDVQVFPPELLSDEDVAIFGRRADDGYDAGCIANRSAQVVGISNIFNLEGTAPAIREAVSVTALAFAAKLPLVGYDRGDSLKEMKTLGFNSVGDLRVWLSQGSADRE